VHSNDAVCATKLRVAQFNKTGATIRLHQNNPNDVGALFINPVISSQSDKSTCFIVSFMALLLPASHLYVMGNRETE
jgi:hypothetical protein